MMAWSNKACLRSEEAHHDRAREAAELFLYVVTCITGVSCEGRNQEEDTVAEQLA